MKIFIHTEEIPLTKKFSISRGTITSQKTVFVELHDACEIGLGEATRHEYYGHTVDSICSSLGQLAPQLDDYNFTTPEALWDFARREMPNDSFALSALDQAAHDLFGKIHSIPVFRRFDLDWDNICPTSVTISIASIPEMIEELEAYAGWPIVKIKLGTPNDLEIVQALRDNTDAVFRVDANCAWTVAQTVNLSEKLSELGVEFIEQPLSAQASDQDNLAVYRESALPIIADESCVSESDVKKCIDRFHGINIKLSKCGGLTPAFRMLKEAKENGLKTMAGCMIESNVSIGAATQLMPLLDFADLDGSVLLATQPVVGVSIDHGRIQMPTGNGNGLIQKHDFAISK